LKLFTRLFLTLQLILFFPSIAFVIINFFEGEDTLHESFIRTEVTNFIEDYRKNKSLALPNSYTTSSFIGKQGIPPHMRKLVNNLEPGFYELETENNPDFGLEQEVKVMITPIDKKQPYFYFFSIIEDEKSDNIIKANLIFPIVTYLCITAVFAYILSRIFAHEISQPIAKITQAIDSIDEENPQTDFSNIKNKDEIGTLAHTISEKNRRIAAFISREKNTIRNISHELRTPVTVIKSTIALIKNQNQYKKNHLATPSLLFKIERSSNDINDIVEAFLWLGKESNTNEESRADAIGCIEKAVVYYQYLLENKDIKLDTNIDKQAHINCPDSIFYILVSNLIRNAFSFTQDGTILITLTKSFLSISDTGPGMDIGIAEKIKEYGIKSDDSPGFGIGLHIVERICENLNWKFTITTKPDNKGVLAHIDFD